MPIDVTDILKEVISECNSNRTDPEQYIKSMEINKRLQLETWAWLLDMLMFFKKMLINHLN